MLKKYQLQQTILKKMFFVIENIAEEQNADAVVVDEGIITFIEFIDE